MQKTFEDPAVLSVARRAGFLEALVDANAKLDTIQRGLNDYLETKRLVSAHTRRCHGRGQAKPKHGQFYRVFTPASPPFHLAYHLSRVLIQGYVCTV